MPDNTIHHCHLYFGLVNVIRTDVEQVPVEREQIMRNIMNRLSYETPDPSWGAIDN